MGYQPLILLLGPLPAIRWNQYFLISQAILIARIFYPLKLDFSIFLWQTFSSICWKHFLKHFLEVDDLSSHNIFCSSLSMGKFVRIPGNHPHCPYTSYKLEEVWFYHQNLDIIWAKLPCLFLLILKVVFWSIFISTLHRTNSIFDYLLRLTSLQHYSNAIKSF